MSGPFTGEACNEPRKATEPRGPIETIWQMDSIHRLFRGLPWLSLFFSPRSFSLRLYSLLV